jgi:hypothetical protein
MRKTVVVIALMACACASFAADPRYPTKPIRFIVPFPPGGGTDIVARMLNQRLSERLGQQVVIDNRGGANAIIGTDLAAKAPADGYTMLLCLQANMSANPACCLHWRRSVSYASKNWVASCSRNALSTGNSLNQQFGSRLLLKYLRPNSSLLPPSPKRDGDLCVLPHRLPQ